MSAPAAGGRMDDTAPDGSADQLFDVDPSTMISCGGR